MLLEVFALLAVTVATQRQPHKIYVTKLQIILDLMQLVVCGKQTNDCKFNAALQYN